MTSQRMKKCQVTSSIQRVQDHLILRTRRSRIAVNQKIENQAKKGISARAEQVPVKEDAPEKKE